MISLQEARRAVIVALFCLSSAAQAFAAGDPAAVEQLRINQLQFIGTHNSYHVRDPARPNKNFPDWSYSHAPLDVQLERGVRSFELDLQYRKGEFFVFHVAMLDEGSTCRTLKEGLESVRKWSDAHPRHLPISFLFELKQEGPRLDSTIKIPDAAALDQLDGILRSVFPPERTITPDDVRGSAATLREAVQKSGWPTLEAARGKVFYILHDEKKERELYTHDHPSLRGRVMFVRSEESREDAATLVMDNPRDPDIPRLVKAGYFIRTRADSGLRTRGSGPLARREAAFASGAQIVSTDFPNGEAQPTTGFVVEFAHAALGRVNPINGPEGLRGQTIGR
ncbi:MAG TPA: Ca2+-dependent phosphoinositide-specific phospholipase C [Planctomycetaceae bacterium]|nr:Ca2+-dependent phosphoinositide-specific phospholipase C [Planctomycetaceae bacterium]